jgi:hypothetical protein
MLFHNRSDGALDSAEIIERHVQDVGLSASATDLIGAALGGDNPISVGERNCAAAGRQPPRDALTDTAACANHHRNAHGKIVGH